MSKEKVILMVDDDADERFLFQKALEKVAPPIECYTANDGKEALSILSQKKNRLPDVIFLDINMPVMTGWECLTKIKANSNFKNIPVVMYSTSSNPRDINIAFELGAECFCTKPEDFKSVQQLLMYMCTITNFQKIPEIIIQPKGVYFQNSEIII